MQVFLETARMILRQFTEDDEDNLFDLDSDPDVMRYLTGGASTPRSIIQSDILPTFLRSYEQGRGFGVFAAIEKKSSDFMGWFGFRPEDAANPGTISLGYRLCRVFWHQGYATEGVHALIHKGFTELGVQRVVATTYQDNLASRRVMEKAGMSLVRTYRITLDDLLASDTFHNASPVLWDGDDVEYALLKADWEHQQVAVSPTNVQ